MRRTQPAGRVLLAACLGLLLFAPAALAEPTNITVRVLSKGAKFIGTSMGGMRITLRDVHSGEILAQGITAGETGDTKRIMNAAPGQTRADETAARFDATLDLGEPRLIEVEAYGPLAQPQAAHRVTSSMWVVPGRHVTAGDGWLLILPGLVVDVLDPPAHVKMLAGTGEVQISANVMMMCGCPIEPGGIWPAEDFTVTAEILRNGTRVGSQPLTYAGQTSQFAAALPIKEPGLYEAVVVAQQKSTGNTGLDRTTFIIPAEGKS